MSKHPAIYIRVSTDAQAEEGYSIDAQKEQLAAYCVSKGLKEYEFYIDGGWSGSNIDRPELQRLVNNIYDKKISHVIVYKLDRLSRSQKDTLYLIEDVFNPNDVAFVSLTETLDTSTPMGRLMIGILSAFAQLERENIRMRTRMGMLERVKSGLWMGGGKVPFGYDYDQTNGVLVPNKDAETVKQIYDLYLNGHSSSEIATTLGLKYDKLVNQIIARKTNYGIIEYNGVEYQGLHEPIIDKKTYDSAIKMMESRRTNRAPIKDHLLTGLIECGHCGAKMRYQKWGKSGRCKIVCYSTQKSKEYLVKDPNCPQERVWADEIENEIINVLFSLDRDKNEKQVVQKKDQLDMLREQKAKIESKIKNLYLLFADSGDDILRDTIDEQKIELEKISSAIIKENARINNLQEKANAIDSINTLRDVWEFMSIKEKQQIVRLIINKIVITDDNIDVDLNI